MQLLTDRVTQQILAYQQNMTVWVTPEEEKRHMLGDCCINMFSQKECRSAMF